MGKFLESALRLAAVILVIVSSVVSIALWEGCKCARQHIEVKVK